MRRLALAILGVVALAFPAVSAAATTVTKDSVDLEITACNGHTVHLTGSILNTFSFNPTASGGFSVAFHSQPQGVSGVDEQTGVMYRGTGLTRDIFIVTPAGGLVETFHNRFHIQATRGEESFDVQETLHITVTPAGTVSVAFDNFSAAC